MYRLGCNPVKFGESKAMYRRNISAHFCSIVRCIKGKTFRSVALLCMCVCLLFTASFVAKQQSVAQVNDPI
jgi:hypothetical protein